MKLYQEMFGEHFDLDFNVDDYPFLTDKSYRNDICPSFYFKAADCYYILWVDYLDASEREDEKYRRYTVVEALNVGNEEHPEVETNHESNFKLEFEIPNDIKKYLNGIGYN